MKFIQNADSPRYVAPIVGRIVLEDIHGCPTQTVVLNVSPVRRERELFCEDGVYVQHRQNEHAEWVYRYDRPRNSAQSTNEHLCEYQTLVGSVRSGS